MNENWPRWIFASVRKHFRADGRDAILTFTEGEERPHNPPATFAEFRMDGPRFTVLSMSEVKVWIAVNILFNNAIDRQDTFRVHKVVGTLLSGFTTDIDLLRLGNQPQDDGERFGCLTLVPRQPEDIRVNHFGQIDPTVQLQQGTIEAHYQTYLTTT